MNQIAPTSINFSDLVKSSNTTLSLDIQDRLIEQLNTNFTEDEQRWYHMYMNYHPTDDYPINLEHVFKMIGFSNKGNAMKTIKNNFIQGEDYKKLLFRMEKQVRNGRDLGGSGLNQETIMLNVDTFKNLCMLAKTETSSLIKRHVFYVF